MDEMSRYPNAHKRATRERILTSADRLSKERGTQAASIGDVMQDAGLTVGGFYAHFASKHDLERETLLFGLEASMDRLLGPIAPIADDRAWLRALIRRYLRQAEEPDLAAACPLTLLLPDVTRGGAEFQAAFSARTAALLQRVVHRFPATAEMSSREVGVAVFAACAGAVAFARTIPAPHARERVLQATEKMLVSAFDL
jgi:TetR/AcrR family transcriptional repressor of nem operon